MLDRSRQRELELYGSTALQHSNIVPCLDKFVHLGTDFLVMEHLPGNVLDQVMTLIIIFTPLMYLTMHNNTHCLCTIR
jgi:serine/threonine protein kinase